MNELIQSAQEAASQGEKSKALDLLKQVLSTNPDDIDALLVLASLAEEPTRKRQVVNRILSLDAVNRQARDMLLEMDRAELNSYRLQVAAAPKAVAPSVLAGAAPTPALQSPSPKNAAEKPLVFRSSTGALAALYLFGSIFCCLGLAAASRSLSSAIPSLGLALLFGLTAVSLSSKVEVTEAGIRTSSLFGGGEMIWNEIASLKSNAFQRKLELTSHQGKLLKVSTQVKGYGVIVELLRQKRPDLFGQAAPAEPRLSPSAVEASPSVEPLPGATASQPPVSPAFDGPRTFQKSFLRQYGLLLALVPFFFLLVWLGLASPESRTASFISAGVCGLLMLIPFFQVSAVKVEPDKLTVETFFEQKELSARQIKEIKMQSLRGRYGRITNIVKIIPVEGKTYPLGGFSDGEEILYGFLRNWWNTYQKQ